MYIFHILAVVVLVLNILIEIESRQVPITELNPHDDRVVGGVEANPHEFPWIVTLKTRDGGFCAGSIISADWVLTAAHCNQKNPEDYTITAGVHDIKRHSKSEQVVHVAQKYTHPEYFPYTAENDIALMRVQPAFKFNDNVKPIALAPSDYVAEGESVLTGWGLTSEHAPSQPHILRKVTLALVDQATCRAFYLGNRAVHMQISDTALCAGSVGHSACFGDSGGPLMCKSENNPVGFLCGTVSGGKACGDIGVYQRVSAHISWITKVKSGYFTEDQKSDDKD